MNECVYTSAVSQSDPAEIAYELNYKKGYYVFENAIDEDVLSSIIESINIGEYLINNNTIGAVHTDSMIFHSHTLAASKECYDIVTHEKIRAICHHFFEGPHKLSNQRIFETHSKSHMPWHTDNNLQLGNVYKGKHTLPGILFLIYLSDVSTVNPFQFIPNSHKWSATHKERYFSDSFIEEKCADDIVSLRAPKGTLILCNTHVIHRAEPFNCPGFKRLTFLFQVDALSENYPGHGEKLLINPSFVDDTSLDVLNYLGFGLKSNYPTFPQTSVATMSPRDLWRLQKNILPKALRGILRSTVKNFVPHAALTRLKNMNFLKTAS